MYTRMVRTQRLEQLDAQILARHADLIESQILDENLEAEDIKDWISDVVGPERVGLVIQVANLKGVSLFRNALAEKMNVPFQLIEGWLEQPFEGGLIRSYAQRFEREKKWIRVGFVINRENEPYFFPVFQWYLFLGLIFLSSLISYLLTVYLMRPMIQLAASLGELRRNMQYQGFRTAKEIFRVSFSRKISGVVEFRELLEKMEEIFEHFLQLEHSTIHHSARLVHELRTPMTLIRLSLADLPASESTTEALKKKILGYIQRHEDFVKEYLSWAERVSTPIPEKKIHAIDAAVFLEELIRELAPVSEGRIELSVESHFKIFADPQDLNHILVNLLTNALKYSPKGEPVKVTLQDSQLVVEDRGPGIPNHVLDRLGEPFNVGTRTESSTGLGLSLVKLLVGQYGWKLSFDSNRVIIKTESS